MNYEETDSRRSDPVAYVEHGFALVDIPANEKGPRTRGWNLRENVITKSQDAEGLTGNVGLAHLFCTPRPTCAIDIDHLDKADAWFDAKGIDLQALLDAPDAVQIVSGKPGRAKLLYYVPEGVPAPVHCKVLDPVHPTITVVEFRCASSNGATLQDLAPPSLHPETGTVYEWGGQGTWSALPDLPPEVHRIWEELHNSRHSPLINAATGPASAASQVVLTAEQIRDLRSALLSMRSDDRDLWVRMGMALKDHGDVGRGLWLEWSSTSDKFNAADAASTWESFAPNAIGYKAVFAVAQARGWHNPVSLRSLPAPPEDGSNEVWPEPEKLPPALKPVKKLDPSTLPEAIWKWAVDNAHRLQCPIEYLVMSLLVSAGAIVGNRVAILPKQFDDSWLVYPVLWGATVGPPGSMKTPTLNAASAPIRHLEEDAGKSYAAAYMAYAQQEKLYQQQVAAHQRSRNPAAGPLPVAPIKPRRVRYVVHDTTYQKLGEIVAENPRGVMVLSDELSGVLQSLDTPGQEAARSFLLAGWSGAGSYSFDRIGRGTIVIPRFALSLYGGFQPERLKGYVRSAGAGCKSNDGLIQRFQLIVWPDQDPNWQFVDALSDKAAEQRMHAAILQLEDLSQLRAAGWPTDTHGTMLLRFAADAQNLFDQWYQVNELFLRRDTTDPARQSHFAKYRSLIPALALLFHLIDGHAGPVCHTCVDRAIQLAFLLKSHAERIYGSVLGEDYAGARALASRLLAHALDDGFTLRKLYGKGWEGLGNLSQAQAAVTTLVEHGWLRAEPTQTQGRPTTCYFINPGISSDLL